MPSSLNDLSLLFTKILIVTEVHKGKIVERRQTFVQDWILWATTTDLPDDKDFEVLPEHESLLP